MKKLAMVIMALMFTAMLGGTTWAEGTLTAIKKEGVLVAGVKKNVPPFGFVDEKTKEIVGYDIDFAREIANRLGVKLELKPVSSANRMLMLMEEKVDIIAATMTKSLPRAAQIDFSYTYFVTGQNFLVKKGSVRRLGDLEGKKIATVKGSTSEETAARALPMATIVTFDDYPEAFAALQEGKVFAVTTDEPILAGLLAKAKDKQNYEIPDLQISDEPYGLGVRRWEPDFLKFINETLLEMERSGKAKEIYNKWFGPNSPNPMPRDFVIKAD